MHFSVSRRSFFYKVCFGGMQVLSIKYLFLSCLELIIKIMKCYVKLVLDNRNNAVTGKEWMIDE